MMANVKIRKSGSFIIYFGQRYIKLCQARIKQHKTIYNISKYAQSDSGIVKMIILTQRSNMAIHIDASEGGRVTSINY